MSTSRSSTSRAASKASRKPKQKQRSQRERKGPARTREASPSTPAELVGWEQDLKNPLPILGVRRLALVDDSGRVRALLGTDGKERPQLKFFDEQGNVTHEAFSLGDYHGFKTIDPDTGCSASICATKGDEEGFHEASLFISDDSLDNVITANVQEGMVPRIEIDAPGKRDNEAETQAVDIEETATPSTPANPVAGFPLIRLRDYAEKAAEGLGKDDVVFMQGDEIFVAEEKYLGTAHKGEWCSLGKLPGGVSAHRVETTGLPTGWDNWWIGPHDRIERLKRLCEAEIDAGIAVLNELSSY